MANQYTLVAGDVQYLSWYLTETNQVDYTTATIDPSSANSVVVRLRLQGSTINTITATGTIAIDSNSVNYVRALVTIPTTEGKYLSEVEVYWSTEHITWKGNTYVIVSQLG